MNEVIGTCLHFSPLRMLRQQDQEFKASVGYKSRLHLNNNNNKTHDVSKIVRILKEHTEPYSLSECILWNVTSYWSYKKCLIHKELIFTFLARGFSDSHAIVDSHGLCCRERLQYSCMTLGKCLSLDPNHWSIESSWLLRSCPTPSLLVFAGRWANIGASLTVLLIVWA